MSAAVVSICWFGMPPPATLLRELREELGLEQPALDGELRLTELGHPLTSARLSPTYGLLTRTVFRSYFVRLQHELPLVDGRRWVSEAEALAGRTFNEETVSAGPLAWLLVRSGAEIDA